MIKKALLYSGIFVLGMYSHSCMKNTGPYSISKQRDSYYLNSSSFSKVISPSGEVGSVYERMEGLLREDPLELELSLKKLQRPNVADSTSGSN